jgi:carbon storage regulator CsrA
MLVLSRRLNQKIVLPTVQTTIQVVGIKSGAVRLGIEAPPEVAVLREEVQDRIAQWAVPVTAPPSADGRLDRLHQLLGKRLQIAQRGLALMRRQLQAGLVKEAENTLDHLGEDLDLLRERLEAEAPPSAEGRKTRALLVEDNANERELLATFLRLSGLDVATAGDGADALDYLRSHSLPDLVLLDMGLPRCDGPTVVRNLRRNPACAGLKIFAVSGHTAEEFDLAHGSAGVNRWFHKPIDPAELVRNLTLELQTQA